MHGGLRRAFDRVGREGDRPLRGSGQLGPRSEATQLWMPRGLVHDEAATNHTPLRYQFTHGDVERAIAEAAVVVEGEFRLNFVTPACLGTMTAIADWDPQGNLTMRGSGAIARLCRS